MSAEQQRTARVDLAARLEAQADEYPNAPILVSDLREAASALRSASPEAGDYWYLCCNCGGMAPADTFAPLKRDDDGWLIPVEPGDMDPILRCPICAHLHTDDDGNPGIEDGTRAEVAATRERYMADPVWRDSWHEEGCSPAPSSASPEAGAYEPAPGWLDRSLRRAHESVANRPPALRPRGFEPAPSNEGEGLEYGDSDIHPAEQHRRDLVDAGVLPPSNEGEEGTRVKDPEWAERIIAHNRPDETERSQDADDTERSLDSLVTLLTRHVREGKNLTIGPKFGAGILAALEPAPSNEGEEGTRVEAVIRDLREAADYCESDDYPERVSQDERHHHYAQGEADAYRDAADKLARAVHPSALPLPPRKALPKASQRSLDGKPMSPCPDRPSSTESESQ